MGWLFNGLGSFDVWLDGMAFQRSGKIGRGFRRDMPFSVNPGFNPNTAYMFAIQMVVYDLSYFRWSQMRVHRELRAGTFEKLLKRTSNSRLPQSSSMSMVQIEM